MNNAFLSLNKHDLEAIRALLEELDNQINSEIADIILFGSKARGDDTPDSDIDVMVVTNKGEWPLKHKILTLGAQKSLEYDVLFNMYTLSEKRWNWMKEIRHPLYRSIQEDGIELIPGLSTPQARDN